MILIFISYFFISSIKMTSTYSRQKSVGRVWSYLLIFILEIFGDENNSCVNFFEL